MRATASVLALAIFVIAPSSALADPQQHRHDYYKLINASSGLQKAKVYLFSSIDEKELQRRAAKAGVQGFLSKNWEMDRVLSEIQKILGD